MGNFNRNGKRPGGFNRGGFGGRPRFGGNRFGGNRFGRDTGDREMHQATCSECGASCEIPFQPKEGRPVFCSDCFAAKKDNGGGKFNSPRFEKTTGNDNSAEIVEQLKALNIKIDKLTEMLAPKTVEEKPKTKAKAKKTATKKK